MILIYYNISIYIRAQDKRLCLDKAMSLKNNSTILLIILFSLSMPVAVFSADVPDGKTDLITIKKDLKSPEKKERRAALKRLSKIKTSEKIQLLENSMKDADPIMREKAAILVGKEKNSKAIKILIKNLESKDQGLRLGSIEGLGEFSNNKTAISALIDLLPSADRNTRWKAVEVLGKMKNDLAIEPLSTIAQNDKDEHVKKAAVMSLYKIGSKKSILALNGLKSGKDKKVSKWSANVLLILENPKQ
jgi:HEAT repeat protein